jgi:hypothetical protein
MATYPPNKKLLLDLIIESVEPLLSHCWLNDDWKKPYSVAL